MALVNVLCDVKVWIFLGIALALVFGFESEDASTILVLVLIAQMSVSLDGVSFRRDDFRTNARPILLGILACFGVNACLTLLTGLFFIADEQLWAGWVMLAAVPCAVSTVVSTLVLRGDVKLSVLTLTAIYVVAILFTPLLTKAILGSAVDPLEIMKYIVLFVAVPFALSFLVKRLHLKPTVKSVFINVLMLLMVFIGLGSRRDYLFSDAQAVAWIVLACLLRTFAVGFVMIWVMRRLNVGRSRGIVYLVMAVWKNSGMGVSLSMALFASTMPDAVLPCAISLVIEAVWFAVMSKLLDRAWPEDGGGPAPAGAARRPSFISPRAIAWAGGDSQAAQDAGLENRWSFSSGVRIPLSAPFLQPCQSGSIDS